MVDFYLTVRFAAELTLPCGQPFHQTGFSGVLHRVGNVVHSPISQNRLPGKPIVVKQTGLVSSFAVSNRFSHTGAVLGGKGFEHTVLHDVPKRTRSCRVVGNAVIIAESPDFAVILVENFQVIVVLEEVPGFCFPVFLAVHGALYGHGPIVQQFFSHDFHGEFQADRAVEMAAQMAQLVPLGGLGAPDKDVVP